MKVTIITPTFNSSRFIISNLKSIKSQKYKNWEQIVIDNKSRDKTIDIIKKNSTKKKIKIISEKDNGIFHAINKGIKLATGDIISILHSDDVYYDKKVLSNITNVFKKEGVDIVYGDLLYAKKNNINKPLRYWKSEDYKISFFERGWSPPHPSFFVKKKIYTKFGYYKNNHGNSSDFELMYRFLEKKKIKSKYLNKKLVIMRYGGRSNKSFLNIIFQNIQILKILKIEKNIKKIINFIVFKVSNRVKQFLSKDY